MLSDIDPGREYTTPSSPCGRVTAELPPWQDDPVLLQLLASFTAILPLRQASELRDPNPDFTNMDPDPIEHQPTNLSRERLEAELGQAARTSPHPKVW